MTSRGSTPFLRRLSEIPRGAQVAIYGAGEGGSRLLAKLSRSRSDVTPRFFIDDHKSGTKDGLPIERMPAVRQAMAGIDLVLVASAYWPDIAQTLRERGVADFRVVHPRLFYDYLIFTRGEARAAMPLYEQARHALHSAQNRRLFELLFRAHCADSIEAIADVRRFLAGIPHDRNAQYMEHLPQRPLRVVIEGGVFDGWNTACFERRLAKDGAVYGFDPLMGVAGAPRPRGLRRLRRVELLPMALWSRSGRLRFVADPDNREGSRVAGGRSEVSRQRCHRVRAISIDEFVDQRKIAKVDLIKLDVEGAELPVLRGAARTLKTHRPQLAVSIYHSKNDLLRIPVFLANTLKDYRFFVGHYSTTLWDTVWYAVPSETFREQGA